MTRAYLKEATVFPKLRRWRVSLVVHPQLPNLLLLDMNRLLLHQLLALFRCFNRIRLSLEDYLPCRPMLLWIQT